MDNLFDSYIDFIYHLVENDWKSKSRVWTSNNDLLWPSAQGEIIFGSETAMELGSPQSESSSFFLCTEEKRKIADETVTVVGPELCESDNSDLPFGKVVLLGVHGFTDDNYYGRYQEINRCRFSLSLYGYMMRAVIQENKEWSRVSKDAMKKGFSLQILGSELISELKKLEYVDSASVVFITSSREDVLKIKPTGDKVNKIIKAMNKIYEKLDCDCSVCAYSDVCLEVEKLKDLHKKAVH